MNAYVSHLTTFLAIYADQTVQINVNYTAVNASNAANATNAINAMNR